MGLPLAIFLYMLFETKYKGMQLSPRMAGHATVLTLSATVLLIGGLTFLTTKLHDWMPVLLVKGRLTPLFNYGLGLPIVFVSLIWMLFYGMTRGRTVTAAWLCIALLASLFDVLIILCGGGRFSIGWYLAKWNTFCMRECGLGRNDLRIYQNVFEVDGALPEGDRKRERI